MELPSWVEIVSKTCILDCSLAPQSSDVTTDSHYLYQIFHPPFWIDKDGSHPPGFTLILPGDVGKTEKHRIYFMGVQAKGIDFRKIGADMGFPAECVEVVERDQRAIRQRFQLFSQSAAGFVQGTGPPVLF